MKYRLIAWSFRGFSRVAGAGGGLVASVATCPLDVVKTKLQAQRLIQGQQGYEGIYGASSGVSYDAFTPTFSIFRHS